VEHHTARDLLEGYVDNSLEPETRQQLETHLASCDECRAILAGNGTHEIPVGLPGPPPLDAGWDEKRMRKTIRRTLGRLVFDAISLWIVGFLALTLISAFAIQPLLVDRGDRIRAAMTATWDLPILTTPGATIDRWRNDSTLFGREFSVDVASYTGDALRSLGTYETDLGIWNFQSSDGSLLDPFLISESRSFKPERLPENTVATVQMYWWKSPITMTEAAALQPDAGDARLLWVGFDLTPAFPDQDPFPGDTDYLLGYNPCAAPTFLDSEDEYFSAGSAGGGGDLSSCYYFGSATVERSLEETTRAVDNLASSQFLVDALADSSMVSLRNIEAVSGWLSTNEPLVASMVITGPSDRIVDLVDRSGADDASLLDIDFWNWES
jgi:hypothetical protein